MRTLALLTSLLLLAAACDGRGPWSDRDDTTAAGTGVDFGPAAAFERRLLFLAPGEDPPTAAGFDFALVDDSTRHYRSARAVVTRDSAWRTLMDTAWSMAPMRNAWRLVPFGDLHLLVGINDELEAVTVSGAPDTRLFLGRAIGEFSPDAGTRLQLREAELTTGGTTIAGLLLDVQLGRSLQRSGAPHTIVASAGGRAATPVLAAATLQPGTTNVEALLAGDGVLLALGEAADGPTAWLRDGQRDDVWEGTRLIPTGQAGSPPADTAPDWRVVRGGGDVVAELRALDRHTVPLPGRAGGSVGVTVARGWLEIREERVPVVAVLRHVRG